MMKVRLWAITFWLFGLPGCAVMPAGEPDILIDHGAAGGVSVSFDRTGMLFGSIGFAPRDLSVSALSFHLRSLDGKGHRFEIFATNRPQHAHWRTPDIDTEAQRLWVFTGRVPAGKYEVALAGVSKAGARDIHWIQFKPAIPVTVSSDGAAYLGRWQLSPAAAPIAGPLLRIEGTDLVLRDTPEEDQALLARRPNGSPLGQRPIDDVLRNLVDAGRL